MTQNFIKNISYIISCFSLLFIFSGLVGCIVGSITFENSEKVRATVIAYSHPESANHRELFTPIFQCEVEKSSQIYTSIVSYSRKNYLIGQKVKIALFDEDKKLAQVASLSNFIDIWIFLFLFGISGLLVNFLIRFFSVKIVKFFGVE